MQKQEDWKKEVISNQSQNYSFFRTKTIYDALNLYLSSHMQKALTHQIYLSEN